MLLALAVALCVSEKSSLGQSLFVIAESLIDLFAEGQAPLLRSSLRVHIAVYRAIVRTADVFDSEVYGGCVSWCLS